MVKHRVFFIWHEVWWTLSVSYLCKLIPTVKCRQFLFPLVDPWSTPLAFSRMKWHGRPPIHEPLVSGLGRRSNYCKILCPIRRLLHQWRSRLRDGTPVHKLKFHKEVRLDFKGTGATWEMFKPLLVDDNTGRCHSMQGGLRDTHKQCNLVCLRLQLLPTYSMVAGKHWRAWRCWYQGHGHPSGSYGC